MPELLQQETTEKAPDGMIAVENPATGKTIQFVEHLSAARPRDGPHVGPQAATAVVRRWTEGCGARQRTGHRRCYRPTTSRPMISFMISVVPP